MLLLVVSLFLVSGCLKQTSTAGSQQDTKETAASDGANTVTAEEIPSSPEEEEIDSTLDELDDLDSLDSDLKDLETLEELD